VVDRGPRGFVAELVGDDDAQVGANLFVLAPGQPMSMYHWEADQEDFLVLSGEALLIVEDGERPLLQWTSSIARKACPTRSSARDRGRRRSSRSARARSKQGGIGAATRTPSSR
jgi:hypothetical protein